MKVRKFATALALTVALAAPALVSAQGRSTRATTSRRTAPVMRQSTVAVGTATNDQARFHYNRMAIYTAGFAQKNADRQKVQFGTSDSVLDRTVSTVLGRHSRFGFTNGAGSLLSSTSDNVYTQRSMNNLGRTVAGTAVKAGDMMRHLGNLLKRK